MLEAGDQIHVEAKDTGSRARRAADRASAKRDQYLDSGKTYKHYQPRPELSQKDYLAPVIERAKRYVKEFAPTRDELKEFVQEECGIDNKKDIQYVVRAAYKQPREL